MCEIGMYSMSCCVSCDHVTWPAASYICCLLSFFKLPCKYYIVPFFLLWYYSIVTVSLCFQLLILHSWIFNSSYWHGFCVAVVVINYYYYYVACFFFSCLVWVTLFIALFITLSLLLFSALFQLLNSFRCVLYLYSSQCFF